MSKPGVSAGAWRGLFFSLLIEAGIILLIYMIFLWR